MARPKKPAIELQTIEDCTRAMSDLLIATTDLEVATAKRDRLVAKLQARYEPQIDDARKRMSDFAEGLKSYYYAHLAEIEQDGVKHVQLANGVMGRRDNPAKIVPLNRNWTWGSIKAALRSKFGEKFFQKPKEPDVDKEALKAAKLAVEELKALGLKLEADETFYAEPARLPEAV